MLLAPTPSALAVASPVMITGSGVGEGDSLGLGLGLELMLGSAEGVGLAVSVGVGLGVGAAVSVGVGVGVGVAVSVGVGVGDASGVCARAAKGKAVEKTAYHKLKETISDLTNIFFISCNNYRLNPFQLIRPVLGWVRGGEQSPLSPPTPKQVQLKARKDHRSWS